MRKPWKRASNGHWYLTVNGRQVDLGKDKSSAMKQWHAFAAADKNAGDRMTTAAVFDHFLSWSERHHRPATYCWYQERLQLAAESFGLVCAGDVQPHHVNAWVIKHNMPRGAHRAAVRCVQRAFNWAADEGLIDGHKLRKIAKPASGRRETLIADEDHNRLRSASDGPFRIDRKSVV